MNLIVRLSRIKMTVDELIMEIRKKFEEAISAKTGWSKNEVLKQLDIAIARAALVALKTCVSP